MTTLTGEVAPKLGSVYAFTEANQPADRLFIMTSMIWRPADNEGDATFVEFRPDEFDSVDIEEVK